MSKIKELILDHRGYTIGGTALVETKYGQKLHVGMRHVFIANEEFNHTLLKKAINDGRFGCKAILSAEVEIFDTYGDQHVLVKNRTLLLDSKQCFYGTKGIHKSERVTR